MSHSPHRDDDAVRALLADLRDPGPMPPDLVARIAARLDQERHATGGATVHALPVVDRTPPSRRFVLGLAGASAAAAVAGIVGVNALQSAGPPEVVAALTSPLVSRSAPAPAVEISGTAYTAAGLAGQAAALHRRPHQAPAPLTAGAVGIGPLASPAGVSSCLADLDLGRVSEVTIDIATYEKQPATVIVTRSGERLQARVVTRSCGGGDSRVLAGPVEVR
ncbi:hypothetical protein [Agilicoccus flavus]|uniref:hypothetical protein n=1 Tax=Agilicoccus flavus TaxID=2775968 RepID=UPI001CF6EB5A|nr:hypothetical protein [Agilicoccus flavus]